MSFAVHAPTSSGGRGGTSATSVSCGEAAAAVRRLCPGRSTPGATAGRGRCEAAALLEACCRLGPGSGASAPQLAGPCCRFSCSACALR